MLTWLVSLLHVFGQKLQLEIEPEWQNAPLSPGKRLPGGRANGISISRLNGLLSHLPVQRADDRWLKSDRLPRHRLHRSRTLDPNLAKHPESGLGLSGEDKAALVAFLKSLTDELVTSESSVNQISKTQ